MCASIPRKHFLSPSLYYCLYYLVFMSLALYWNAKCISFSKRKKKKLRGKIVKLLQYQWWDLQQIYIRTVRFSHLFYALLNRFKLVHICIGWYKIFPINLVDILLQCYSYKYIVIYTMRTNLLNWCNLVSISQNASLVVRIY